MNGPNPPNKSKGSWAFSGTNKIIGIHITQLNIIASPKNNQIGLDVEDLLSVN
jgi:hypothetical protein